MSDCRFNDNKYVIYGLVNAPKEKMEMHFRIQESSRIVKKSRQPKNVSYLCGMQILNRDNKRLKILIANTIVNHIFLVGWREGISFWITTYLTFRKEAFQRECVVTNSFDLQGNQNIIYWKHNYKVRFSGAYNLMWLVWLINYLHIEQYQKEKRTFKRKCVKWSIPFLFPF